MRNSVKTAGLAGILAAGLATATPRSPSLGSILPSARAAPW